MIKQIKHFLHMDSSSGILLVIAGILAMIVANTPLFGTYEAVLTSYVAGMSVSHWINDALMAVFFLLIGLEVKRELKVGALRSTETAIFPAIAAIGGMLVPALIYLFFNFDNPETVKGWAIPAATDIAFALGVLSLLGTRVPVTLKVFLLALAIIDDLGVIIIIALFYTADLNVLALAAAAACVAVLVLMNFKNVLQKRWYLLVGVILWVFVYKSGIHATLAGVIVGFTIPLVKDKEHGCPLKDLEHALHPYVSFLILPIFAFANAAIPLAGVSMATLTSSVPMGAALGLFLGKPIGVFMFSWLAVKAKFAKLPAGVEFTHIAGVSVLCGIGFTMSIFISLLAFGTGNEFNFARLGILFGSTAAGFAGYVILHMVLPSDTERLTISKNAEDEKEAKEANNN